MKVEYLSDGSDGPLLRIYDFDSLEAQRLRELFLELAEGRSERAALDALEDIEMTEQCAVTLRVGAWDRGLRKMNGDDRKLECVLREETWGRLAELTDAFCDSEMRARAQWLDTSGQIKLLLSVDGQSA